MAQLLKNSTAPIYSGTTVATMQSTIASLIAAMAAGQQINAADVRLLKTATYDYIRTHFHTAVDTIGIDGTGAPTTYGPAPGQTTTATSSAMIAGSTGPTGGAAPGAVTTPAGIAAGQPINASDINAIIAAINALDFHYHTVTDQVGTAGLPTPHLLSNIYVGGSESGLNTVLTFGATGTLVSTVSSTAYGPYNTNYPNQWIQNGPLASGAAANYEIFISLGPLTYDQGGPTGAGFNYNGSYPTGTWTNMTAGGGTISALMAADYTQSVTGTTQAHVDITYSIRAVGNSTVLATGSTTFSVSQSAGGGQCCFPAGSQVLMADCTWKAVETIEVGDLVMGMGKPEPIIEMSRPVLGNRRLLTFDDQSITWSEEHAFWTKDAHESQWWWSANATLWRGEARAGVIGGLTNNASMRTGRNAAAWAHVEDGWRGNTVKLLPEANSSLQLYLPRTSGSPIIVNGYVVGAGVNQAGYDYDTLDWDAVKPLIPATQPIPKV